MKPEGMVTKPSIVKGSGISIASGRICFARMSCCCSATEVTTTLTSPVMAAVWQGADPL